MCAVGDTYMLKKEQKYPELPLIGDCLKAKSRGISRWKQKRSFFKENIGLRSPSRPIGRGNV